MQMSHRFVPRWRNSRPETRKRAIQRLRDIKMLERIAAKDADPGVCRAAVKRLACLQGEAPMSDSHAMSGRKG